MTATQDALDRVTRVPGVRGALVVAATDGLVVAAQLMDGIDGQAAAALTGSLVGRLGRTAESAGLRPAGLRPAPRRGAAAFSRPPDPTTWCSWPWSVRTPTSGLRGWR